MVISMRKAVQKVISVSVLCLMAFTFLTVCGAQEMETLPEDAVETVSADAQTVEAEETAQMPSEEELMPSGIVIDFPFPKTRDDDYEDAVLILVCVDESAGTYELRLYDKDKNMMQQIPCGELTEPVRFSYDYDDLEIFSDGSQSGLLFVSDYEAINNGKLFWNEAVEIPVYDECASGGFLVFEENETCRTETLYRINKGNKSLVEVRRLTLQKEDSTLEIWDCLDDRSFFEGEISLQEDGSLVNEEYYQYLFRENQYPLWQDSEDDTILVWVSETEKEGESGEQNGFEWAQEVVWGNTGHQAEYENRRTFLADFGFADKEPFYQYYDYIGNLKLELYLDEASGKVCGLIYGYTYNYQMEKQESAYGFAFDAVYQGEWEAADPYSLTTVFGSTGEDAGRGYEEIIEYTEDGKIDYYKSMAFDDWFGGEEEEKEEKDRILEINFIYRDDGTLFYRDYAHNSVVFETTSCSRDSYYDELGRVVYESSYITHGSVYEYYIYDDGGKEPKYYLYLDDNLGYCIPTLVRFH